MSLVANQTSGLQSPGSTHLPQSESTAIPISRTFTTDTIAPAAQQTAPEPASSCGCLSLLTSIFEAFWNFITSFFTPGATANVPEAERDGNIERNIVPLAPPGLTPLQQVDSFLLRWKDERGRLHPCLPAQWKRELESLPRGAYLAAYDKFREGEYKGRPPTQQEEFAFMAISIADPEIFTGLRKWRDKEATALAYPTVEAFVNKWKNPHLQFLTAD